MKLFVLSGLVLSLAAHASPSASYLKLLAPKSTSRPWLSASQRLLSIDGRPAVQGSEFNLFIRPTSQYGGSYIVLDASLDGVPVALEHPVEELWLFNSPQFESLVPHVLSFSIYLEDAVQADQLNKALADLAEDILNLQTKISNTTDQNQLDRLNALLAQKQALQTQLGSDLLNLKNLIGTETYGFSVAAAPSDSIFPRIASISPDVGAAAGGTAISISGANFVAGASVLIGGKPATNVAFVSSTNITAVSPAFALNGIQNVMVSLPISIGDVEQRQALLANAFYITGAQRADSSPQALQCSVVDEAIARAGMVCAGNAE